MTDSIEDTKIGDAMLEYEQQRKSRRRFGNGRRRDIEPAKVETENMGMSESETVADLQNRVTQLEKYIMRVVFENNLTKCKTVLN